MIGDQVTSRHLSGKGLPAELVEPIVEEYFPLIGELSFKTLGLNSLTYGRPLVPR